MSLAFTLVFNLMIISSIGDVIYDNMDMHIVIISFLGVKDPVSPL